jgi:L-ribulose-5-phosphate 3-epimerase
MPAIGFMQGRLSPKPADRIQAFPKDSWKQEFTHARELKFQCIELIYDVLYLEQNPLATDTGRRELKQLAQDSHVKLHSICADYFMVKPLLTDRADQRKEYFEAAEDLFHIAKDVGCPTVEFPFVDSSSLKGTKDQGRAIDVIHELTARAKALGLRISIESDLAPIDFKTFISNFSSEHVGINLDLGNSAALGYDALAECQAYGDRIFNVHIKDRVLGGTTVPLTTGNTDFERCFTGLSRAKYKGDFILQTCPSPDYLGAARKYREMVEGWISKYKLAEA